MTVTFPRAGGGMLGAILVQNKTTHKVYTVQSIPGLGMNETVTVGTLPHRRAMTFNLLGLPLSIGR